jgi:hypothetical protein
MNDNEGESSMDVLRQALDGDCPDYILPLFIHYNVLPFDKLAQNSSSVDYYDQYAAEILGIPSKPLVSAAILSLIKNDRHALMFSARYIIGNEPLMTLLFPSIRSISSPDSETSTMYKAWLSMCLGDLDISLPHICRKSGVTESSARLFCVSAELNDTSIALSAARDLLSGGSIYALHVVLDECNINVPASICAEFLAAAAGSVRALETCLAYPNTYDTDELKASHVIALAYFVYHFVDSI